MGYFEYSKTTKVFLIVYILGFAVGTLTHTIAFLQFGIIVNPEASLWKNIYWTSLTLFDPLTVVVLFCSLRPGLIIANVIIISDVIINLHGFSFPDFDLRIDYRLACQILFCIYVLITTPLIFVKDLKSDVSAHAS